MHNGQILDRLTRPQHLFTLTQSPMNTRGDDVVVPGWMFDQLRDTRAGLGRVAAYHQRQLFWPLEPTALPTVEAPTQAKDMAEPSL